MSFNEWKSIKLGDIVDISSSKRIFAKEYVSEGIPFYRGKEIIEKSKGDKVSNELFISRDRYTEIKDKFGVPKTGDILLTSVGTLGIPYLVEEEEFYFKDGNLTWFKNFSSKCDNKFIYFWLQSIFCKNQIYAKAIGSTQKALTIETLKNFDVLLPPLKEQKAIVDILSSLDDKIELNNQMNQTLEEMAQALFKRWFVDFEFPNEEGHPYKSSGGEMIESELGLIPKDWKIVSLKDYCTEITRGQTPKYVESSELLVLNQKVNKGRTLEKQYFKFLNPDLKVPQNKYCRQWDVLLNSLGQGTLGRVHLYKEKTENVVVDQHITIIRNDKFASIYLYNLLSTSQYQGRLDSLVSGSTGMLMLNISKIREMCIPLPSYELVVKFGQILESAYENIATNEYINEKLVHIRDSLLPKLMSGEIRVGELES